MYRAVIIAITFLSFFTSAHSQDALPSYLEVARHFFSNYSHEREEPYDRIFFAKKKDGWYVNIVDITGNNQVKSSQLFWDIKSRGYITLRNFGPALLEDETEVKVDEWLKENDTFLLYGFERCRYFGYNEWDVDLIRDFGTSASLNDTLLEGLGRAYASYGERFMWSGFGGEPFDDDTLKSKLEKLDIPGRKRIDMFIQNIQKSINYYALLAKKYPGYQLRVGSAKMKLLNEQIHLYQQLMIAGYKSEAAEAMRQVENNDSIYIQLGQIYLNSCPPNAILITYGDNDTYPLWYVQQKMGFRKDVTVLNNSLMGLATYINMVIRDKEVKVSIPLDFISKPATDYFFYDTSNNPAIKSTGAASFIRDILQFRYSTTNYYGNKMPCYPVKKIDFDFNLPQLQKLCKQSNLTNKLSVELRGYLLINDLLIFDIVQNNIHNRPICFSSLPEYFTRTQLQAEGIVYRLLPLNRNTPEINTELEVSKAKTWVKKYSRPVIIDYPGPKGFSEDALYGKQFYLFSTILKYYNDKGNKQEADEMAALFTRHIDHQNMRYSNTDALLGQELLRTSFKKEGQQLIEDIAHSLIANYRAHNSFSFYQKKQEYADALKYLSTILSDAAQNSDVIEKLVREIENE